MGDAVMAFWEPPFTQNDDHARLACRSALDQSRAIARLQAILPEITGLPKNLPIVPPGFFSNASPPSGFLHRPPNGTEPGSSP